MEYSIGSLADLISGSNTPNKRKVVEKEISPQSEVVSASPRKKRRRDDSKPNVRIQHESHQQSSVIEDGVIPDTAATRISKGHKKKSIAKRPVKQGKKVESLVNKTPTKTDVDQKLHDNEDKEQVNLFCDRTIFVGNVAISTKKGEVKKLFERFGKIEAIRFRCAPLADPRTSKKVAAIKKEFHQGRQALHSYIRFATRDEALKAISLNGHSFKELHLRVNICDETDKPSAVKAIFVGNIPFDAEEEDLWKLFEVCGSIESVRLIRDGRTNIGKGFGYVNFKSTDAVHLALEMDDMKLKNRVLRISQCKAVGAKKRNKDQQFEAGTNVKKHKLKIKLRKKQDVNATVASDKAELSEGENKPVKPVLGSEFQGKKFGDKKKKKKFDKGAHKKKKMIKQIAPRSS